MPHRSDSIEQLIRKKEWNALRTRIKHYEELKQLDIPPQTRRNLLKGLGWEHLKTLIENSTQLGEILTLLSTPTDQTAFAKALPTWPIGNIITDEEELSYILSLIGAPYWSNVIKELGDQMHAIARNKNEFNYILNKTQPQSMLFIQALGDRLPKFIKDNQHLITVINTLHAPGDVKELLTLLGQEHCQRLIKNGHELASMLRALSISEKPTHVEYKKELIQILNGQVSTLIQNKEQLIAVLNELPVAHQKVLQEQLGGVLDSLLTNDHDRLMLLHTACKSGNITLVEHLLKQPFNLSNSTEESALYLALIHTSEEHEKIAHRLINAHAKLNETDAARFWSFIRILPPKDQDIILDKVQKLPQELRETLLCRPEQNKGQHPFTRQIIESFINDPECSLLDDLYPNKPLHQEAWQATGIQEQVMRIKARCDVLGQQNNTLYEYEQRTAEQLLRHLARAKTALFQEKDPAYGFMICQKIHHQAIQYAKEDIPKHRTWLQFLSRYALFLITLGRTSLKSDLEKELDRMSIQTTVFHTRNAVLVTPARLNVPETREPEELQALEEGEVLQEQEALEEELSEELELDAYALHPALIPFVLTQNIKQKIALNQTKETTQPEITQEQEEIQEAEEDTYNTNTSHRL